MHSIFHYERIKRCAKKVSFYINRLENKKSVHFRTLCPKVNVRLFAVVRKAHSETSAFTYFGGDGDGTIQTFDDGLTNTLIPKTCSLGVKFIDFYSNRSNI